MNTHPNAQDQAQTLLMRLPQPRLSEHDGHDGMVPRRDTEAGRREPRPEVRGVGRQAVAQLGALPQHAEHLQGGPHHGRSQGVGEEVRARLLPQELDHLGTARGVAAGGPAAEAGVLPPIEVADEWRDETDEDDEEEWAASCT